MLTQPSLLPRRVALENTELMVLAMSAALDRRGWLTAKHLSAKMGLTDRALREIARRSDGAIISGQRGYHLTAQASVEDVQHFVSWMRSQAREMDKRALQAERAMHRRVS